MKAKTAKERALRLLSISDRSCHQLKQRLEREGFSPQEITKVISSLKQVGYLDDKRYAENFVSHCNRFRPMGNLRLEAELLAKGIPREIVHSFLNSEETQLELGKKLASQKYAQISATSREKRLQKLVNHLGRKGFNWETIRKVLPEVIPDSLDTDL